VVSSSAEIEGAKAFPLDAPQDQFLLPARPMRN
jgi:hypothetical protein